MYVTVVRKPVKPIGTHATVASLPGCEPGQEGPGGR